MQGNQADEALNAIQALIQKMKPNTSTTTKSAVVALYTADGSGELRYSGCIGLLQLDMDRHLKATMIRLYDLDSLQMVFQVQLYYGFSMYYRQQSATFFTFEYPLGIVGLLYKNKE